MTKYDNRQQGKPINRQKGGRTENTEIVCNIVNQQFCKINSVKMQLPIT